MCPLYGAEQSDALPHVDVPVEGAGVGEFVPSARQAQDGLQLPRLPEHAPPRSQRIPTEGPELHTHTPPHTHTQNPHKYKMYTQRGRHFCKNSYYTDIVQGF